MRSHGGEDEAAGRDFFSDLERKHVGRRGTDKTWRCTGTLEKTAREMDLGDQMLACLDAAASWRLPFLDNEEEESLSAGGSKRRIT